MKDLQEYQKKAAGMLDECNIPYGNVLSVEVNPRFTRKWGSCRLEGGAYRIFLNPVLLYDDVSEYGLIDTLLHEYLHTCPGCMNHGALWKKYAAVLNARFGYGIKRTNTSREKKIPEECKPPRRRMERKYKLRCVQCGNVYSYARRTKAYMHPEWCRCGKCHGPLVKAS